MMNDERFGQFPLLPVGKKGNDNPPSPPFEKGGNIFLAPFFKGGNEEAQGASERGI